jgi:hypothetical protein
MKYYFFCLVVTYEKAASVEILRGVSRGSLSPPKVGN